MDTLREEGVRIRKALMTGVGYMIPFVVFGGILIALTIAFSEIGETGVNITNPVLATLNEFGGLAMQYMIPILGAFIAYGIADRAGIMPGFVGSAIAANAGTGFLGALVAGILAGYIVELIKKIPLPVTLKSLMPIFIVPLLGGVSVALLMQYVICVPLTAINSVLTGFLVQLQGGNALLLGAILGFMTALDLGGPVNVVACLFAWAMFSEGVYTLAGPVAVGICTPPLGMGLATLLSKKKYDEDDREAGKASLLMGMIGISEGAIPFAAKDPLRVIPANCIGGMVGGVVAMAAGVTCYAPHGGPIVTMVCGNKLMYLLAIVIGSLVTALIVNGLKKEIT